MNDNMIPRRAENLLERDVGDSLVVLGAAGEELHTFKGSALFIWRLIDGNRTIGDIVLRMLDEYDVERGKAAADLETFLESLSEKSLLGK